MSKREAEIYLWLEQTIKNILQYSPLMGIIVIKNIQNKPINNLIYITENENVTQKNWLNHNTTDI